MQEYAAKILCQFIMLHSYFPGLLLYLAKKWASNLFVMWTTCSVLCGQQKLKGREFFCLCSRYLSHSISRIWLQNTTCTTVKYPAVYTLKIIKKKVLRSVINALRIKLKYNYYVIILGYAVGLHSLPLKPKHGAIYMSSFLVCQVQHEQESLRQ
jgi:hypothetical protein